MAALPCAGEDLRGGFEEGDSCGKRVGDGDGCGGAAAQIGCADVVAEGFVGLDGSRGELEQGEVGGGGGGDLIGDGGGGLIAGGVDGFDGEGVGPGEEVSTGVVRVPVLRVGVVKVEAPQVVMPERSSAQA